MCITQELAKMGADITVTADGLVVKRSSLRGAEVDSHGDHRMAMALAVAAFGAEGDTTIRNTACIGKTYPNFAQEMQRLGANLEETHHGK